MTIHHGNRDTQEHEDNISSLQRNSVTDFISRILRVIIVRAGGGRETHVTIVTPYLVHWYAQDIS